MEVVTFIVGVFVGVIGTLFANRPRSLSAIEKDLTESYRGETFEKRAKRASK